MLALRLEQGRRGGSEVEQQKDTTAAWQSSPSARHPSHRQGINIREKISQWEGRSQQGSNQEAGVKANPPSASRRMSGDVLGNGALGVKPSAKVSLSKSLEFWDGPSKSQQSMIGRRSEPVLKCFSDFTTTTTGNKPLTAQRFTPPKLEANIANASGTPILLVKDNSKVDPISPVEIASKPLPLSTDFQEDNMPAGNFYTSRGFWRKLEGDRLLWEKGRDPLGGAQAPPKPLRTFQYRGANGNSVGGTRTGAPPTVPPPPCPVPKINGLLRHKKSRKSFEYEDAARLTLKQSPPAGKGGRSNLCHAYSDDNIYEDIVCEVTRDNPYDDVKLSPMCLPIGRSQAVKQPHKNQMLQGYANKVEKKRFQSLATPKPALSADGAKIAASRRIGTQKLQRTPQYINKIDTIFDDKRGRKRVKNQGISVREETSGTESDPEDNNKAGPKRSVYIQSTLKPHPGYRTLEKDLIQRQQQQLFQIFVVVSLRKSSSGNNYSPEITQQFPKMFEKSSRLSREAEDQLKVIPKFCFPDSLNWEPSSHMPSETFSFVLTGEDGSRWFCYCRKILPSGKGKRLPEVHCIVSKLGCFNLFAKILEEVERRREISPALVYPFMRSVMEAPFPAPGRTVTVKIFLPGSGNEVITLCRPVDSRLEHVDFDSLLQCLSVDKLLQVFASILLERRVILIADTLSVLSRCCHAVLALLYPFTWQHTFIPVLPASMLDVSCSPTPFLIGVLAPCLPQLLELPIEEVLIVDLCADKFVVQLGDEDCILPSKLQAALQQILEEREDILNQVDGDGSEGQQADLSSLVSEGFVRFFVELVGHYGLHMVESSNGSRELQRDSFRKSHPSRGVRQFLQLFMDTQMFAGFIQDKELAKGGARGLFEVRVAEYLDSCPEPEPSGVNKFLKGLGKLLQVK
ncbi:DENN domain-containing protein 2C isoform X4 [Takifugu flavidus]|uniref:DENN domain-containing protein 2C isoform X4 n=1 Tax=Takifugu flavidus TaxID=433684 RepID=UPI002544A7A2|nr:DENN domain-containing protein 2C isoform X4 [Takifugu flavidus]